MVRHNNVVPNQHFHKTLWQDHVKTWFDQAARKKRRRVARATKAAAVAPRPVGLLRPAVHPPTNKYNYKLRQGRGFTFAELKEAGVNKKEALGIGIAVDHRRRNRSAESLQLNSQRLKEYMAALILFPKKSGKPKKGDSSKEEISTAQQVTSKTVLPLPSLPKGEEAMVITSEMKSANVFHKLRETRADYRLYGVRQRNRCARTSRTARGCRGTIGGQAPGMADQGCSQGAASVACSVAVRSGQLFAVPRLGFITGSSPPPTPQARGRGERVGGCFAMVYAPPDALTLTRDPAACVCRGRVATRRHRSPAACRASTCISLASRACAGCDAWWCRVFAGYSVLERFEYSRAVCLLFDCYAVWPGPRGWGRLASRTA